MNEIIDNLWLGGIDSFYDIDKLREKNIGYVLTAMRGDITLPMPQWVRYQVELDDTDYDDLLVCLPPAVAFIEAALKSGKGILIHCVAGISRSASIVTAYLMYSQKIDLGKALKIVQGKRPIVGPNESFLKQLELFHAAACQPSSENPAVRRFYLERAVHQIMKGETAQRAGLMSQDPSPSAQGINTFKRRIRCRMCRQELASADHVMHTRRFVPKEQSTSGIDPDSLTTEPLSLTSPLAIAKLSEDVMNGLKARTTTDIPSGALGVEVKQAMLDAQLAQSTSQSPAPTSSPSERSSILPMRTSRTVIPPASRPPVLRPVPRFKGTSDSNNPAIPDRTPASTDQGTTASNAGEAGAPPPPIIDPICSGYFLEPMKWMEDSSFAYGQIDGRILCPNSKCGAKLGNYAWAGVRCSCGEWVTPGFCIHKTRVDELWQ